MGIEVNSQNVDKVIGMFQSFVSDSSVKSGWGKGAIAYLFPGLRNSHLEAIDKPIFASRSPVAGSYFKRTEDDKAVNNYVRHLFLNTIAKKLNCSVDDIPRIFKWAGKLGDLKIDDFNANGRPLTARRIGIILNDLAVIEQKRLDAENKHRSHNNGEIKLKRFLSANILSKHDVSADEQKSLPKFDENLSKKYVPTSMILEDISSDNYIMGKEMMSESHANDTGSVTLKKIDRDDDNIHKVIETYKHDINKNDISKWDKDFKKTQIKVLERILNNGRNTMWKIDVDDSNLTDKLNQEIDDVNNPNYEKPEESDNEKIY